VSDANGIIVVATCYDDNIITESSQTPTHTRTQKCSPQGPSLSVLLTLAATHALPRLPGYGHANIAR